MNKESISNLAPALQSLYHFYHTLSTQTLHEIDHIYDKDIQFQDPIHLLSGVSALKGYFIDLMQNIETIHFTFNHIHQYEQQATIEWVMTFTHPKMNSGKAINVEGTSLVTFNDKITHHRDYFDVGVMVYEQLPIIGRLIRFIKSKI